MGGDITVEIKKNAGSSFTVVRRASDGTVISRKRYHWECQSTPDNKILIRIFEYDAQLALDQESRLTGARLTVTFPHSAVLFLRSAKDTPEQLTITIETPGGSVSYAVPAVTMDAFELEDIFEKHLYFLIPYYAFKLEKQFPEIDSDAEKLREMAELYRQIRGRLEQNARQLEKDVYGRIDEYTYRTLMEMSWKVLDSLADKYRNIRKEVGVEMTVRI